MTDFLASSSEQAAALARWTRLSDSGFGACYVSVCLPAARSWKVIIAAAPQTPKLEACQEAAKAGFLDELARAVANWESQEGRASDEIQSMFDSVLGYGILHAMTSQQKGFMDARILMPLLLVSDASAVVFDRKTGQRHGTAFLVRPDLVLTAAHVVVGADTVTQEWLNEIKPDLGFRFKAKAKQSIARFVEILPADEKALVSYLLPHGSPPNVLDRTLNGAARQRLDFALVRLAQRVDHVSPVPITDGVSVEKGKPCWAFGFPGGDALMMDVDVVTDVHNESGRWLHKANATHGMSGGCCVNHQGDVAGLHEGAIATSQGDQEVWRNRGVSISAIRDALCLNGRDPLKEGSSTPGLELQDATVVTELYLSGKGLAGTSRIEGWRKLATEVLGVDPEFSNAVPTFHPWFSRRDVEEWIDSSDPEMRLCLIHGDAGVGKSFCARILQEKMGAHIGDLFCFNPTQLSVMSWRDAIGTIVVSSTVDYRTASASVRYQDFQEVIEELQRRSVDAHRSSFVVMDFGSSGSPGRFAGTQWMELIAALLAAEGVRLMAIGLDELERSTLVDRLFARPETEPVAQAVAELEIRHIRQDEFRSYIKTLARARGLAEPGELNTVVQSVFGQSSRLGTMVTVMAALAAIKFEASMT